MVVFVAHLKKSHLALGSSLLPPGLAHTQNCLRWLGPAFFTVLSTQGSLCPLQRGGLGGPVSTLLQTSLSCCWEDTWSSGFGRDRSSRLREDETLCCESLLEPEFCEPSVDNSGLDPPSCCERFSPISNSSSSCCVFLKNESSVCEELAAIDFEVLISLDGKVSWTLLVLFTGNFLPEDEVCWVLTCGVPVESWGFSLLVKNADNFCCLPANSTKWFEQRDGRRGEGVRGRENSAYTGQWSEPSTCCHTALVLRCSTSPTLART